MDSQTIVGLEEVLLEPQHVVNVETLPIAVSSYQAADTVQIDTPSFVVSSGDMYGGNGLIGQVPSWILDAIKTELTTGEGNIQSVIDGLKTAMDALPIGVSQSIASLNTLTFSQSSLITGLRSSVNNNHATVIDMLATKVTPTEAQAISTHAIESTFGTDVNAFIGNIASTYVDANSAIAQEVNLMQTSISDNTASISTINKTLVTLDTAIATSVSTVTAEIGTTEARIIQSYTVYVDENLSYDVEIWSSNGNFFRRGNVSSTLTAKVKKGPTDVTATIPVANFSWRRISANTVSDDSWNMSHASIGPEVIITPSDVWVKAIFECDIIIN